MRNSEKIIFVLSVFLTLVSVAAYCSRSPFWLLLSSAAASYGYWMSCGNVNSKVDEFFNRVQGAVQSSDMNEKENSK